jgi:hypothetical protein
MKTAASSQQIYAGKRTESSDLPNIVVESQINQATMGG